MKKRNGPPAVTELESNQDPGLNIKKVAAFFKLLEDETRLQIVYVLIKNVELNVSDISDLVKKSQPAVSHHLDILRAAGALKLRRAGARNYYSFTSEFCDGSCNAFCLQGVEEAVDLNKKKEKKRKRTHDTNEISIPSDINPDTTHGRSQIIDYALLHLGTSIANEFDSRRNELDAILVRIMEVRKLREPRDLVQRLARVIKRKHESSNSSV